MSITAALMGILPLLLFVIVDSLANMKWALIVAIIMALSEAAFSVYTIGTVDILTGFSIFLVIVLAFLTYYKNNSLFFKFQPVILSLALGLALIISYLMDQALLYVMTIKYKSILPAVVQANLQHPKMILYLKMGTLTMGIGIILHGIVTAYAALKLSNWWWIAIRGLGFYGFLFLSNYAAWVIIS